MSFDPIYFQSTEGYSYTIDASAEPGGSISPSGLVTVASGADQTFTITPDPGYEVFDVVTGSSGSVGAVSSYTFTNVTADDTITASFYECTQGPARLGVGYALRLP